MLQHTEHRDEVYRRAISLRSERVAVPRGNPMKLEDGFSGLGAAALDEAERVGVVTGRR